MGKRGSHGHKVAVRGGGQRGGGGGLWKREQRMQKKLDKARAKDEHRAAQTDPQLAARLSREKAIRKEKSNREQQRGDARKRAREYLEGEGANWRAKLDALIVGQGGKGPKEGVAAASMTSLSSSVCSSESTTECVVPGLRTHADIVHDRIRAEAHEAAAAAGERNSANNVAAERLRQKQAAGAMLKAATDAERVAKKGRKRARKERQLREAKKLTFSLNDEDDNEQS